MSQNISDTKSGDEKGASSISLLLWLLSIGSWLFNFIHSLSNFLKGDIFSHFFIESGKISQYSFDFRLQTLFVSNVLPAFGLLDSRFLRLFIIVTVETDETILVNVRFDHPKWPP